MPSTLSNSPFLSLRSCESERINGLSNENEHNKVIPASSTKSDSSHEHEDEFLRLPSPQQDVLLLHGPRQKYKLEQAQDIPELRDDREILVQVLAVGLNPVDWKGADFGFGQPSYPWVNGRDFAGIVVRGPKQSSRIHIGDVVCGPSTDYRDVRKASYQEYLVSTDYNVARIPAATTVKIGAAVGVAWAATAIGLGVSLGLDFSSLKDIPTGPDLYRIIRSVNPSSIPKDVQEECLYRLSEAERPKIGEWLVIWGASSATALFALQLAKRAGLRVICVADSAKHGTRLYDLGADILVDRLDQKRALSIIKSITGGKLRFAIDAYSTESAQSLQTMLSSSGTLTHPTHLLSLAGPSKVQAEGVVQHTLPIKIFHDIPEIGESVMAWLEELLLAEALSLPHVEIAEGGLAGVNDALDRLRRNELGAKRIVVPVTQLRTSPSALGSQTPIRNLSDPASAPILDDLTLEAVDSSSPELAYADALNSSPDRIRFAYWVPNVSGGLVISKIPQKTNWSHKANIFYARTAERVGFELALTQIRFMAGYGAENQHESVSLSQALLHATKRLRVIAAILPGPWNPTIVAKQLSSISHYSEGRIAVMIVFGWFKAEFTAIGQWWLDHAERYRRGREMIECLRGIWTEEKFSYRGDFYQFHDYPLKPKPYQSTAPKAPTRSPIEIFQGGNSEDARETAAAVSDVYFMNGNTLEGFKSQIEDLRARTKKEGRTIQFAVNAFVIARETQEEALHTLRAIQGAADTEAVEGFRQQVQNAGAASKDKKGMWADSKVEDLVQYNDGFKTKLIGTYDQVAERVCLLKAIGMDIILCGFLHYDEELRLFGEKVLPLVRRLEKEGRGKDEAFEIDRTGDVYRAVQK